MEKESWWNEVDPRHIRYTKKNVASVHINSVQLPEKISSILGYTLTGDLT
jgi:hypothetical protein